MDHSSKPFPELKLIAFLIGRWNTQGVVRQTDQSSELPISGTDIYEWVSDGFFILHTVDVVIGEERVKNIEVIGFESASKNYSLRSFDNQGNFLTMYGSFNNNGHFVIAGENMRATLKPDPKGKNMTAFWEQLSPPKKNWDPWMDITLSKS